MPRRILPLRENEIYHLFNRSIMLQPLFSFSSDYRRMLELLDFYHYLSPALRYSHFKNKNDQERQIILHKMRNAETLVEIFAFSLMPNHYHLLVKQRAKEGISRFLSLVQNSYARYFNIKAKRYGALFQTGFKAVRIENENQFLHVVRYIHLNPVTSYVVSNISELKESERTSFRDYLSETPRGWLSLNLFRQYFKTKKALQNFHSDQVDYQRKLSAIKHLIME